MTENELLKKIAIARSKPQDLTDLQPRDLADLVLVVLDYVKQVNKAIEDGKIKGDRGDPAYILQPDKDYLSLPTAKRELDKFRAEVVSKITLDVQNALSTLRNGKDGQAGRDGQDAVITKANIEEAANLAFGLIELPDFRKYITEQPEAIRDSLELLQGEDRLDASAIKNLPEFVKQNFPSGGMGAIKEIIAGSGITVNNSNLGYPVISSTGSGGTASIEFVMDGGGATLPTGIMGDLNIDFDCTINSWTLLADQTGSVVVDIWKDSFINFPPLVGDSITGSSKPTLTAQSSATSSTLTGWTTSITAGDVLRFKIDSVTSIQRLTLSIKVTKT